MRTSLFLGAAAITIAAASSASAQDAQVYQVQSGCYGCARGFHHGGSGVEIALHGGVGGFLNDSSTAFTNQTRAQDHLFWPGAAAQGEIGWRFGRSISVTGHFTYQNNLARDLPLGTTGGWANSYAVGVNVRAYIGGLLHVPVVNPWVAVGFDPWASVYVTHTTPIGDAHNRFTAVAVPMSIGLDFDIVRQFGLGVMAQASPWLPREACSDTPATAETCTSSNLGTNWYGFVGATARFTITD